MQEHLRDYVWMALPGGTGEKVPATTDEINRKMVAGYSQVFPDAVEAAVLNPWAPVAEEEQQ
jgi:hypothetical protein